MNAVAVHLLRQLWRDRRLPIALGALAMLLVASIALEARRAADWERERRAAEALDGHTFESQGARNPHSVAHFSRFAFLPRLATNGLDPGVSEHAGTAVWMQAHSRDPANARPAEDQLDVGRAAALDLAWIWRVLAPLFLIALGFDAISGERERRTLPLLLIGGRSLASLVLGKAAALWAVITACAVASAALTVLVAGGTPVPDVETRVAWWLGAVVLYSTCWVALVLAVSTWARSSRAALSGLLALWTAVALVAPPLVATLADERAPAPAGADLRAQIQRDREQGFDGHAGAGEREKAFEAKVLAEYGVDDISKLPVSFAGLALDEDERVGNAIFDKHYAALARAYRHQRGWRRLASLVTPLPALQHVTMAAAGTSVEHHLAFTSQAEQLRRTIIALLNADMIANGKGKDFAYEAGPALWAKIPTFQFHPPALAASEVALDLAALTAWLALSLVALALAVRAAERQVAS